MTLFMYNKILSDGQSHQFREKVRFTDPLCLHHQEMIGWVTFVGRLYEWSEHCCVAADQWG